MLWHIFCITVWSCPKPSDALLQGRIKPATFAIGDWIRLWDDQYLKSLSAVHLYLFTTGSWQYWDMFAPDPAFYDWYGDAVIHYKNGSTKVSLYPRMFLESIPKKYLEERFRKFYERAHNENDYPYIFPQFCYRQALLNYTDPNNPPVRVELRRHWLIIAEPGMPQQKDYLSSVYYIGEINKNRLDALAGHK